MNNLENDFSQIVTTIDNLKQKIDSQSYITIMKHLKNIYDNKRVKQVVCLQCKDYLDSSDAYESESDTDNEVI